MAGLTLTGFSIKRLTDILADLKTRAAEQFGAGVNTDSDGALGKYLGLAAYPLSELWELALDLWDSFSPSTAQGVALDSIVELNNLIRLAADETEFWARLDGTQGTTVPAGATVLHPTALDVYATAADVLLAPTNALRTETWIQTNDPGAWSLDIDGQTYSANGGASAQATVNDLARTINRNPADPPAAGANDLPITAVNQVARRFDITPTVPGDVSGEFFVGAGMRVFGSTGGVNDGIYTVESRTYDAGTGVTSVVVAEDIPAVPVALGNARKGLTASTVAVADAEDPDTAPAADTLRITVYLPATADDASEYAVEVVIAAAPGAGGWAHSGVGSPGFVQAVETGPKAVNRDTRFDILAGAPGWTSLWSVLAGDTGRDVETDTELRARRLLSLQQGGSTVDAIRAALLALDGVDAVFVYENDTDVAIGPRPPHSVEAVVEGGLPAAIARSIFDQKAAGIRAYGTHTVLVVDTMGVSHGIGYSRVTLVSMHVVAQVRALYTEETLPDDAAALIAAAIETWGNAHTIGRDVIAARALGSVYTAVPGLGPVDVLVREDGGTAYALDESDAANDYLYLEAAEGNVTAIFTPDSRFTIEGNAAGLNGCYTVQASAFVAGRTRITVDQDVTVTTGPPTGGAAYVALEVNPIADTERAIFEAADVLAVLPP